MKLSKFLLVAASGFLLTWANGNGAMAEEKKLIIGIPAGTGISFWSVMGNGAETAANEFGYQLEYRGTQERNEEGQRTIFNDAIEQKAVAIFIAPNAADRKDDVAKAKSAGIPVVYVDRDLGGADINSFIGTDSFAAGKKAGQEIVDKLGTNGKHSVAIIHMDKNVLTTVTREEGALSILRNTPNITVVEVNDVGATVGDARQAIDQWLGSPQAAQVDAMFTPNESTTTAAIAVLKNVDKAGKVILVGFDSNQFTETEIKNGVLYGTIVQQPYEMGYQAVKVLDDILHGKAVEKKISPDVLFVDAANLNDKAVVAVLHPKE